MADIKKILKIEGLKLKEFYNWPLTIQVVSGLGIFVLISAIGAGTLIKNDNEDLIIARNKEEVLKKDFLDKKKQAINLDLYHEQLIQVQTDSENLLKQLPNQSEIANLLVDINQAGLSRGLVFELFKPEKEKVLDFYAEVPVTIRVKGSYKAIGEFASDLSQLSRVVILTDMTLSTKESNSVVYMDVVAKTFRYLDQSELDAQKRIREEAKNKNKKKSTKNKK